MALIAHTGATSNGNAYTTSAIDTTGATLIAVIVTWFNGNPTTLSDSKSNGWTSLTTWGGTPNARFSIQLRYVLNPTVGSGHTFSFSGNGGNGACCVLAFDGVTAFDTGKDIGNSPASSSTTIQPGSLTPSSANNLLICARGLDDTDGTPVTIDSGFTLTDAVADIPGSAFGVAAGYLIQTSATAQNPTITRTGVPSNPDIALMAAFTTTGASFQYARPVADDLVGGWTAV